MELDRRTVLKQVGLGALAFVVAGERAFLTPRQARAASVPMRTLSASEAALLDALGETLLPGAAEAGISNFVDQQISGPPIDCLLVLRYFDVPPPYAVFYQRGLAAVDAASVQRHGKGFAELDESARIAMVESLRTNAIPDWTGGIPGPRYYFAFRSDAVDVVYGTQEGFEKLDIPYMAHIEPVRKW